MNLISTEINESLKKFNAAIGRLDIISIRNLKKMKKRYRDYINDEI